MLSGLLISALLAESVHGYAFVARMPGVDNSLLRRDPSLVSRQQPGSAESCPFNPNHTDAVPINAKYPYCGAIGGVPGKQSCPNNLVPAKGDSAHAYKPAGKNDVWSTSRILSRRC